MVLTCSAKNCKNRFIKGGAVTFHKFPKNEIKRMLWERNVNRENFKASKSSNLCSVHFLPECFDRNKLGGTWLKQNALPTIFDYNYAFTSKNYLGTLAKTCKNGIKNNSNHISDISNQQNTENSFNPVIISVNSALTTIKNETFEEPPVLSDLTVLNPSTNSTVIGSDQGSISKINENASNQLNTNCLSKGENGISAISKINKNASNQLDTICLSKGENGISKISKINENASNQLNTNCLSKGESGEREMIFHKKDLQMEDLQSHVEVARILYIVRRQDDTAQDVIKNINEIASERFHTDCLSNEDKMKRKRLSYIGDFQIEDLKSPVELEKFLCRVKKQDSVKSKQIRRLTRAASRLKNQIKVKDSEVNVLRKSVLRLKKQLLSCETLLRKEKHCSVCGFPKEELQNGECGKLEKDGKNVQSKPGLLNTKCLHNYSKLPGTTTKRNTKNKLLTESTN